MFGQFSKKILILGLLVGWQMTVSAAAAINAPISFDAARTGIDRGLLFTWNTRVNLDEASIKQIQIFINNNVAKLNLLGAGLAIFENYSNEQVRQALTKAWGKYDVADSSSLPDNVFFDQLEGIIVLAMQQFQEEAVANRLGLSSLNMAKYYDQFPKVRALGFNEETTKDLLNRVKKFDGDGLFRAAKTEPNYDYVFVYVDLLPDAAALMGLWDREFDKNPFASQPDLPDASLALPHYPMPAYDAYVPVYDPSYATEPLHVEPGVLHFEEALQNVRLGADESLVLVKLDEQSFDEIRKFINYNIPKLALPAMGIFVDDLDKRKIIDRLTKLNYSNTLQSSLPDQATFSNLRNLIKFAMQAFQIDAVAKTIGETPTILPEPGIVSGILALGIDFADIPEESLNKIKVFNDGEALFGEIAKHDLRMDDRFYLELTENLIDSLGLSAHSVPLRYPDYPEPDYFEPDLRPYGSPGLIDLVKSAHPSEVIKNVALLEHVLLNEGGINYAELINKTLKEKIDIIFRLYLESIPKDVVGIESRYMEVCSATLGAEACYRNLLTMSLEEKLNYLVAMHLNE